MYIMTVYIREGERKDKYLGLQITVSLEVILVGVCNLNPSASQRTYTIVHSGNPPPKHEKLLFIFKL